MRSTRKFWLVGAGAIALSAFGAMAFAMDTQEAHNMGQLLGNQRLNEVGTSQFNQQTAEQIPFYKENPIQQDGYDGGFGNMLEIGASRITQSSSYTSGSCDREQFDPQTSAMKAFGPETWLEMTIAEKNKAISDQITFFDQECDAINFLADDYGGRVRKEIHPDDELNVWLPERGEGVEAGVCSEQTINIPAEFAVESCHETASIERRYCREVMNVSCTPQPWDGCSPSGVVPATNSSDTETALYHMGNGDWHLSFGSIGDDYWNGGYGTIFDRTLNVEIQNLESLTHFSLNRVDFDDWLLLSVNGHIVYVGPLGGDRIELVPRGERQWMYVQYSATQLGIVERTTSHNVSLNIDLRPFLHNGVNTIFARTAVGGGGEMYSEFLVRAMCEPECEYNWASNCSAFDQVPIR